MNNAQKKLIKGFLNGNAPSYAEPYHTNYEGRVVILYAHGIEFATNYNGRIEIDEIGLTYDMEQAVKEIKKLLKIA